MKANVHVLKMSDRTFVIACRYTDSLERFLEIVKLVVDEDAVIDSWFARQVTSSFQMLFEFLKDNRESNTMSNVLSTHQKAKLIVKMFE
jgi:hypothetical protein